MLLVECSKKRLGILLDQPGCLGMGCHELAEPRMGREKLRVVEQARILFHFLLNSFDMRNSGLSRQFVYRRAAGRWPLVTLCERRPGDREQQNPPNQCGQDSRVIREPPVFHRSPLYSVTNGTSFR